MVKLESPGSVRVGIDAQCLDNADSVELLDGSVISVRCLDKDDVGAVLRLHRQLTDREQYMRFFVAHPAYLKTFAEKVVVCDERHWGLGAFEADRLIGVANYVVLHNRDDAEVAVAVGHHDHLRGVATVLLRRLAKIALGNGVRNFTADVLANNSAMLNVLSDAGWRHTTQMEGSVLSIRIDLSQFDAADVSE